MSKTPKAPLLVDASMHTAFAIKYLLYAIFGLLGAVMGSPTLTDAAGHTVSQVVAFVVFIASSIAAVSTSMVPKDQRWETAELYSTIGVVSFVSVYSVSAAYLAFVGGDNSRLGTSFLAAALLVFPAWRIVQIVKQVRRKQT